MEFDLDEYNAHCEAQQAARIEAATQHLCTHEIVDLLLDRCRNSNGLDFVPIEKVKELLGHLVAAL